ncbi:hypothetical protein QR680_018506 [Steinernema hermaphroditum]|uniref:Uncharacterized protein n=1 Tax=Steinernema hermaphroditum TaxID=289476 RepID=A0AA39LR44_9BILA|nr:hypothetical protein QR680_018506 [Steinernema hermaphroditum]
MSAPSTDSKELYFTRFLIGTVNSGVIVKAETERLCQQPRVRPYGTSVGMKLIVLLVALLLLVGVFAEVASEGAKPKAPFRVVKKPAKGNGVKNFWKRAAPKKFWKRSTDEEAKKRQKRDDYYYYYYHYE